MKSIVEQIFSVATRVPEKIACVFPSGEHLSYADLVARISCAAQTLSAVMDRSRARHVLLAAEKTPEFFATYFGAHLSGVVAVPVDPECNAERFESIVSALPCALVSGNFSHAEKIASAFQRVEFFSEKFSARKCAFPPLENLADIVFTTGTTGAPKGVCLTQKNLASATRNINAFIGTRESDTEVVALPVCHSFGLGRVRCALSVGATLVFVNGFVAVKRLFRALEENRATGFAFVPAAWSFLKKMSGGKISQFAETLRYLEIGSAPMPEEDKKMLAQLLPQTRICMHYGLTEASRSAFLEFHADAEKIDTLGCASPNVELGIFSENGECVPVGEVGEICVRGDHVMRGYLDAVHDANAFFSNGFLRTGDLGSIDAEGTLRLTGRIKEIINVGGKKVSPEEVERALATFPEIEECACVGVADPEGMLGEVVKAFVVLRNPAGTPIPSRDELTKRLRGIFEDYKIPREYEVVPALPKTASGKLQRGKLKNFQIKKN